MHPTRRLCSYLSFYFFFTKKKISKQWLLNPEFCSLVVATPSCCADYLGYRPSHGSGCAIQNCQGLHIFLKEGETNIQVGERQNLLSPFVKDQALGKTRYCGRVYSRLKHIWAPVGHPHGFSHYMGEASTWEGSTGSGKQTADLTLRVCTV